MILASEARSSRFIAERAHQIEIHFKLRPFERKSRLMEVFSLPGIELERAG